MSVLLQRLRPQIGGTRYYEYQPNGAWTISTHLVSDAAGMRDGSFSSFEATVCGFDVAHYSYLFPNRAGDTDDFIGFDMEPFTATFRSIDYVDFWALGNWQGRGGFREAGCFIWPAMDLVGGGTFTGLAGSWDTIRSGWEVKNGSLLPAPNSGVGLAAFDPNAGLWFYEQPRWITLRLPYQPVTPGGVASDPSNPPTWTAAALNNRSMGIHIGPLGIGQAANRCACYEYFYEVYGTRAVDRRGGN